MCFQKCFQQKQSEMASAKNGTRLFLPIRNQNLTSQIPLSVSQMLFFACVKMFSGSKPWETKNSCFHVHVLDASHVFVHSKHSHSGTLLMYHFTSHNRVQKQCWKYNDPGRSGINLECSDFQKSRLCVKFEISVAWTRQFSRFWTLAKDEAKRCQDLNEYVPRTQNSDTQNSLFETQGLCKLIHWIHVNTRHKAFEIKFTWIIW